MRVIFVLPDGQRQSAELEADETVMLCARRNAVPGIIGECGGSMMCGTCHVYVADDLLDRLPDASDEEKDLVEGCIDPRDNSRLGCQLRAVEGLEELTLFVPESQT